MFWKEKVEYWDIFPEWTEKKVGEICENNINLSDDMYENRWAKFGFALGTSEGLDNVESVSMSSIVSGFMTGMPVSAGTELYYNEDKIDGAVLEKYNTLDHEDEIEKRKELIDFILDLYKNNLNKYEYKNARLDIRLTQKELSKLLQVPGGNKTEKFKYLLNYYNDD